MLVLSPMDEHHIQLMSQLGTNASLDLYRSPQRNSPPLRATPKRLAASVESNDDHNDDCDLVDAGHGGVLEDSAEDLDKENMTNVENLNAKNSRNPIHSNISGKIDDPLHEHALSASVSDFLKYFEDRTMTSLGGFVDANIKKGRKNGVKSQAKPLTRHHRRSKAHKARTLKNIHHMRDLGSEEDYHGDERGAKQVDIKAVLRPNQFFGETALLDNSDGKRSASIFARTHVTLLSMQKQHFLSLMALLEDPSAVV